MGSIRFTYESDDLVIRDCVDKADFITFDGRVLPCEITLDHQSLLCVKQQDDSSKLRLMCRVADRNVIVHTTSLKESEEPYQLEIELARGEVARLRTFFSLWTGAGLKSNALLENGVREAQAAFREAVFSGSIPAACSALEQASAAGRMLVSEYVRQRITFRKQRQHRFPMSVGCRLTKPPVKEDAFLKSFNSVLIKTRWNELEPVDGDYQWEQLDELVNWVTSHNMFCIGGPLLDLSSNCFPDWMSPWKGDVVNLQSFTSDFVETVVGRYVGRIRHWEVVCGANRGGANQLSEEQRLNLVARAIDAAQQVDEQIQISVRVIQPWGEYLCTTANRLAPIQFVDTLRRSGVRLSEINLDLRFGNKELDSLTRDPLSLSQLLDHWSLLQLPINVMMALPDPIQSSEQESDIEQLVAWQSQLFEDAMLLCLSKERVIGFYCLNWNDDSVHDQPLVDPQQNIHPIASRIEMFQENWWAKAP